MHPDHFMRHEAKDWGASEHFLRLFVRKLVGARLPPDVDLIKLDVPEDATPDTPWRLSRLSRQRYFEMVLDQPGPDSRLRDGRITVIVDQAALEPDSDVHALGRERVVAVTPLSLDATSRADFGAIREALGA
ncbi:5'/3'-nucleotidase SurE [mine drainage metagenome]|uniref:5'/3'-nucleotidase SurE n=1 Tax=mine drainage metagenome TaxID=410659 RepID=A0A1J5PWZ0_9ZZZZ